MMRARRIVGAAVVATAALLASSCQSVPGGFAVTTTHSGLARPTSFDFAPDGRLFVGEKRGVVKTFDSLADTTPTVFADLRTQVHNSNDRGLVGVVVDPAWPERPYVYVHYAHDALPGGTAPAYGAPGVDSDPCPEVDGLTNCPATIRVSRLAATEGGVTETVLLDDVCHQFPVHDGGGMAIGPEGALYVSLGEGAYYEGADYGNWFANPCGDPGGAPGTDLRPPAAEGGSLRAQDLRTTGDPLSVDGSVIRIDPDTGAAWPGNPLGASADPEARKLLAHGLRNPFRLALRPGTNEVWVGDVGSYYAEEINRIDPGGAVENFGWPCYEGQVRNPVFDRVDLTMCERLYAAGGVTSPSYHYCHGPPVQPGRICSASAGAALSGLAFYEGGAYPDRYDGALFFADYVRDSIRVLLPGSDGRPSAALVETFATDVGVPVDLHAGPHGDLFFVDPLAGTLRRIYVGDPGDPPDPGDGGPEATITGPDGTLTWSVGEDIAFSGSAVDGDGAPLPASTLSWSFDLLHCYNDVDCHRHGIRDLDGVASGLVVAPDHEYPAKLELTLRVDDGRGGTDATSVVLHPRTVDLTFATDPAGLEVGVASRTGPAPLPVRAIVGSRLSVSAPSPQRRDDGAEWEWVSWSDGGDRSHTMTAPGEPTTLTATFERLGAK